MYAGEGRAHVDPSHRRGRHDYHTHSLSPQRRRVRAREGLPRLEAEGAVDGGGRASLGRLHHPQGSGGGGERREAGDELAAARAVGCAAGEEEADVAAARGSAAAAASGAG